jgi:hypothetical protein
MMHSHKLIYFIFISNQNIIKSAKRNSSKHEIYKKNAYLEGGMHSHKLLHMLCIWVQNYI